MHSLSSTIRQRKQHKHMWLLFVILCDLTTWAQTTGPITYDTLLDVPSLQLLSEDRCPENAIVSIPDVYQISFDLMIQSWHSSSGYIHIFEIAPRENGEISLRYDEAKEYLYFKFDKTTDSAIYAKIDDFPINTANNLQWFHILLQVTQSYATVFIDGSVVYRAQKPPHALLNDKQICFALGDRVGAGAVKNFIVTDGMSFFDATEGARFDQKILNCVDSEPCVIQCHTFRACYQATINCPHYQSCNITCAGMVACYGATIEWPQTAGLGSLSCSGQYSCGEVEFPNPDPNTDLTVECDEQGKCFGATIHCPSTQACDVICNGVYACWAATIHCPPTESCKVTCCGQSACSRAMIEWPETSCDAITRNVLQLLECEDIIVASPAMPLPIIGILIVVMIITSCISFFCLKMGGKQRKHLMSFMYEPVECSLDENPTEN